VDTVGFLLEEELVEMSTQGRGGEGLLAVLTFTIFGGEIRFRVRLVVAGSRAFWRVPGGFFLHVSLHG
jgi:hypothetical protein